MIVKWIRSFALFWYDFVVGDDWRLAVGVIISLGLTALLAATSVAAWWAAPLVVIVVLVASTLLAGRKARKA